MSSPDQQHPLVTPELVRYLDEAHPNRCPSPEMGERDIWMAAGAARVVAGLKAALADQTARAINTTQDPNDVHLRQARAEGASAADRAPVGLSAGPGNRIG